MNRVKAYIKNHQILSFLYLFSLVIAVVLSVVSVFDHNYSRVNNRLVGSISKYDSFNYEEVEDLNGPMGLKKIYTSKITKDDVGKQLCFYMVHYYARVYINDIEVYHLVPDGNQLLGKTLGCDWAFIPIRVSDIGKTLRVELTPVYEIAVTNDVNFLIGNALAIYMSVFYQNLPILILCLLLACMGIILIITGFIHSIKLHIVDKESILIGAFSLILTTWKFLDTNFSPLLFIGYSKAIFNIQFTISLVGAPTLALYFKSLYSPYKKLEVPANLICHILILLSFVFFFLQIFNIVDYRELLSVQLGSLFLLIIFNLYFIHETKRQDGVYLKEALYFFNLMTVGFLIDMFIYVTTRRSDFTIFSYLTFFIYSIVAGIKIITNNSEKTYRDFSTGLYNKNYCTRIMKDNRFTVGPTCAIMIDLNDLKLVNDLYGHEEGDKLIKSFSDIINSFSNRNTLVGRFGGDEFVIFIKNCSKEEVTSLIKGIEVKVNKYNEKALHRLSYALGYQYCSTCNNSLQELLIKADDKMYQNKLKMKENN